MTSTSRIFRIVVMILICAAANAQPQSTEIRLKNIEDSLRSKAEGTRVKRVEDDLAKKADATDVEANLGKLREDVGSAMVEIDGRLRAQTGKQQVQSLNFNRFWVLLAALLVFFMQAGFKCLEVGMVGPKFGTLQALYKLAAWTATLAGYFFSFGLMFSATSNFNVAGIQIPHFKGECVWSCAPDTVMKNANSTVDANGNRTYKPLDETDRGMEFFLFQLAFAATAVTIPAGAIAERMSLAGYFMLGLFMAFVVYPLFGHWAWGGGEYMKATPDVEGWLKWLGFHDFAGSTVVHSVGGWFALAAAKKLGPRTQGLQPQFSRGYAVLGVFLLWFGWWGFNGGSTLLYDNKNTVPNIILNTNIAGAIAGLVACAFAWSLEIPLIETYLTQRIPKYFRRYFNKGNIPEKTIGGFLGGLVAITASCDVATPLIALVIGILAGIVHNLGFDWLRFKRIDDPIGAIPVHAYCGVAGTLLVNLSQRGPNDGGWIQIVGIGVAFLFSYYAAKFWLWLLAVLKCLRLSNYEKAVWSS